MGGEQAEAEQKEWTNQVLKYDILSNSLSELKPMLHKRSNFAIVNNTKGTFMLICLEHKITVIGGVISLQQRGKI